MNNSGHSLHNFRILRATALKYHNKISELITMSRSLSLTPHRRRGWKVSSHSLAVKFKVLKLLHPMSEFNKNCWKSCAYYSSFSGKTFRSIQDILSFWEPFKVQRFNLSSPHCIPMAATLGACNFFIKCSFSIKKNLLGFVSLKA